MFSDVFDSVKKLLTDALNKNQYLRRLELQQIKDMVECMYECTYQQGEYVIKQGEPGNHLFVLAGMFVLTASGMLPSLHLSIIFINQECSIYAH